MINKNLNTDSMIDARFFLPESSKYNIPSLLPFFPITNAVINYLGTYANLYKTVR